MSWMFAQVDYSKDEQWHAWNQEALKRFLIKTDQLPQEKLIIPKSDQYLGLGTALNSETIKGGWWPSRTNPDEATSPLFLEEKPDLFGLEDVFNECNQAVALEDDVWEIATVSVLCSVHALYVVPT